MPDYKQLITIEPGKRGGKPCIRGMRITVGDIGWLREWMQEKQFMQSGKSNEVN
ncbi:DUF433 domain-containing protein [Petrimonas sp.]|uniref:DUF433 domain-containing protein n=1 Tax=Petrimonas sp. TaxID=2023866 RepID=UPI001BD6E00F